METLKFGKGKIIFEEGAVEACMYDIVSGSVAIYSDYGKAGEKKLVDLKEGYAFGEMGMIENKPRSATAVANERTEVNLITVDEFAEYFKDKPEKVMEILRNTSHRVRTLTKSYLDVCNATAKYVAYEVRGEKPDAELMAELKKFASAKK